MKVTINGMEVMDTFQHTAGEAIPVMAQAQNMMPLTMMQAVPSLNVDKIGDTLVQLGQNILIGTAGVIVVVAGILMAVGLKKEGWKKVVGTLQGLGVGLVGPTAVLLVAGFFTGFAQMLN